MRSPCVGDAATLPVLRKLPFDKLRFREMTVEHDAYRTGDHVRQEMRNILRNAGYELIAADVIYSRQRVGTCIRRSPWYEPKHAKGTHKALRWKC